jgi:DnaJ-class molecular chaperone
MKKWCPFCRGAGHRRWYIEERHKGNALIKFKCDMCNGKGEVKINEERTKRS